MANDRAGRTLCIEVIYAQPDKVWSRKISVPDGSCVADALRVCDFVRSVPGYPHGNLLIGIYGQVCSLDRRLAEGDRVEIYRPLTFDPMESRRRRAAHRKAVSAKSKNQAGSR